MRTIPFSFMAILVLACAYACNDTRAKTTATTIAATFTDSGGVSLQLVTDAVQLHVQLCMPADGSHRKFICDNAGKIWVLKNDSLFAHSFS